MNKRQIFPAAATHTTTAHCTPFTLPSRGFISINPTSTVTLTTDVVFIPACTSTANASSNFTDGISSVSDVQDPFHASVTPQVYATGAATVLAWMLVIMLLITPRTFFVGSAGGTVTGLRGRRGLISGATGGASVIGVGSRPWLQKVAALTVAVSLTIATADTFRVAERQYDSGIMNAEKLRSEVVGSLSIKISRVISDIFLWLAQIQTLIRLFPRHKEKVLIKWIGFAMIILDVTFSCLNTFISTTSAHDGRFVHALPALSYLFQLALSMLYAAWVLYYAATKRRYAFYHKMMWNMSLVALLSIVAILTPVVFFITDISNHTVAGWGDYFRWVGAAASSVIVWEWVERIEALEREEKKDGILGREIFDGDEMLDLTPSEEVIWPGGNRRKHRRGGDGSDGNEKDAYTSGTNGSRFKIFSNGVDRLRQADFLHHRPRFERRVTTEYDTMQDEKQDEATPTSSQRPIISSRNPPPEPPAPPDPVASPVSRSDNTSAASTVYAVRYYPAGRPSPPIFSQPQDTQMPQRRSATIVEDPSENIESQTEATPAITINVPSDLEKGVEQVVDAVPENQNARQPGFHILNPFKRKRTLPPAEVRSARVIEPLGLGNRPRDETSHNYSKWDVKSRLGHFAAEQADRFRDHAHRNDDEDDLPVTIIPAQPRGKTWSPEDPMVTAQNAAEEIPDETVEETAPRRSPPMGSIGESLEAVQGTPTPPPPRLQQQLQPATAQRSSVVPSASSIRPLPPGTQIVAPPPSMPGPVSADLGREIQSAPRSSPDGPS